MPDDFKNAEIMQESETAIDTDSYVFWYGELSLQLRQYKQAFEKQNAQFAKMNEAFQRNAQDMSVLTTENANLKKAESETRKLLREKDVEIEKLSASLESLPTTVKALQSENFALSERLSNSERLNAERGKAITERDNEIGALRSQNRELAERNNAVVEQQATQIQQYAQELQQQTMVIQSLEEQLQKQSEELQQYAQELEQKNTQIKVLEEQLQKQSEELQQKNTQIKVLDKQPKSELEKKPKKKRKA